MTTLQQRVKQVIQHNRVMRSNSRYSDAQVSVYAVWKDLTEGQKTWITLTLTANELDLLNCILRLHDKKNAADLIYLIKNRIPTEQLAYKLGIENTEI
jgi:hypothetical protein